MDSSEGIHSLPSRTDPTNEPRSISPSTGTGIVQDTTYSFDSVPSKPRRNGHSRTESNSSSGSSNDGIEWEDDAGYYNTDGSEDDEERDDRDHSIEEEDDDYDDYQDGDTQRLLSSSNTRTGGLGMGMRVGETGTGTTIGLDFEHQDREYDQDYDVLPMTTIDGHERSPKGKSPSSRRKLRRDRHRILQPSVPVMGFFLSSLTLLLIPSLRPKSAPSAWDFGAKIMPCAVASGLDVGLSNSSLKTITLAFYKKPTWKLAGIIGVICVGLFMMVMSEVDFVLIGFIEVMLASVLGGLRWSLTQLLLERTDTKSGSLANPISTIFFLSPIMGICLCIVAGVFEGFGSIIRSEFFQTFQSGLLTLGLLFLGGIFAFAMVLAEFNLIARTSVVSLSVLGIIKEVVTILISSLVFHDQLTVVNIMGLFITLAGIGFYHYMKLREMKHNSIKVAREIADMNLATAANQPQQGVRDHRRKRSSRRESNGHLEEEMTARRGGFEELNGTSRMDVFGDDDDDGDRVENVRGGYSSRENGVKEQEEQLIQNLDVPRPTIVQHG
ncbi:Triose-phosphate Transporter [Linnemannia zychae]|nr:Triose-phosphate Transporter [Linnemannia zychae]